MASDEPPAFNFASYTECAIHRLSLNRQLANLKKYIKQKEVMALEQFDEACRHTDDSRTRALFDENTFLPRTNNAWHSYDGDRSPIMCLITSLSTPSRAFMLGKLKVSAHCIQIALEKAVKATDLPMARDLVKHVTKHTHVRSEANGLPLIMTQHLARSGDMAFINLVDLSCTPNFIYMIREVSNHPGKLFADITMHLLDTYDLCDLCTLTVRRLCRYCLLGHVPVEYAIKHAARLLSTLRVTMKEYNAELFLGLLSRTKCYPVIVPSHHVYKMPLMAIMLSNIREDLADGVASNIRRTGDLGPVYRPHFMRIIKGRPPFVSSDVLFQLQGRSFENRPLFFGVCGGWSKQYHVTFPAWVQETVYTLMLISNRASHPGHEKSTTKPIPVIPNEMWVHICTMLLNRVRPTS
jgi:hypothetical protein